MPELTHEEIAIILLSGYTLYNAEESLWYNIDPADREGVTLSEVLNNNCPIMLTEPGGDGDFDPNPIEDYRPSGWYLCRAGPLSPVYGELESSGRMREIVTRFGIQQIATLDEPNGRPMGIPELYETETAHAYNWITWDAMRRRPEYSRGVWLIRRKPGTDVPARNNDGSPCIYRVNDQGNLQRLLTESEQLSRGDVRPEQWLTVYGIFRSHHEWDFAPAAPEPVTEFQPLKALCAIEQQLTG